MSSMAFHFPLPRRWLRIQTSATIQCCRIVMTHDRRGSSHRSPVPVAAGPRAHAGSLPSGLPSGLLLELLLFVSAIVRLRYDIAHIRRFC